MFLQVKYRAETDKGTMLFLEHSQIPAKEIRDKIYKGEPFAYTALNEYREAKVRYMGRNRVVCTGYRQESDGLLLYVSLYIQDLGKGR